MNATHPESGNGSSVLESLTVDGVPSMTTFYHLDGADLRMRHFCHAQNQPRLKAHQIDFAKGILDFEFVDAANLRSPANPHVYGLGMRLLNADHVALTLLFEGGGKHSKEFIHLKRVGHEPPTQPP
jgi:hypothetical protein